MFILGYEGDEPYSAVNKNLVTALNNGLGGVIFFTQNITNKEKFHKSVEYIKKESLIKPFLSIDQEGGRVERTLNLHNGRKYLSARDVAKKGVEFVEQQAEMIASELLELGLNMNFAPVLDVDTNPNNPIIAERSYSSNPDIVAKMAKVVVDVFKKHNIVSVGKHFPGHGETNVDSHLVMPELNLSFEELKAIHLKPFELLLNSLPAIMVAHIYYSAFDIEKLPASISQNVVDGYLRQNLGYGGLVVSDDMVMGGIKSINPLDACIKGINAGVNMFIYRNSDDETLYLIEELEKAVIDGKVPVDKVDKSVAIIQNTKCF
jgi:beta-N-acetylhexosaminidase